MVRRGTSLDSRSSDPRKPDLLEQASRLVHVGPRTEPDEEPLHAVTCKERDQSPDAVGAHALFRATQMHAVEIGGGIGRLAFGIDRHVGLAERHAVESTTGKPVGVDLRIQPSGEPFHFSRQVDRVHGAPHEMRRPVWMKAREIKSALVF